MRASEDASLDDKGSLQKAPPPPRRGPDARFMRIQEAMATLLSLCH